MHPGALQHRAAGATGDHTGTRAGRTQHHNTGRGLALHGVNDGATDQRNAEEVLACFLHTLGDRRGDFLGLAVADTDHALAVADDDQRGEAEPAATLDHLGDAVDRDDPLQVVALVAAVAATTATTVAAVVAPAPAAAVVAAARCTSVRVPAEGAPAFEATAASVPEVCSAIMRSFRCSQSQSLETQSVLAGGIGQGGDPAAVGVPTAVEDDGVDAGGLGALGDQLTDADAVGLLVALDRTHVGLDR